MESKNIILILIVIIVILAAAIGVALLNPANAKNPVQVKITSENSQNEGGEVSIKLTDMNKTAIAKQIVNVTVTDSNGNIVVDDLVKTDSKGKGKLDMDLKKGEYVVNATYGGNDNYTGNTTSQKLTINDIVEANPVVESSSQSQSTTHIVMGEDGYYARIDDNGNILEDLGPSKKYHPDDPNAVDYPDAEPMWKYIDKSQG